jgi:hypothetical protein
LGSNGSVVPLFTNKSLMGPITITHPDIQIFHDHSRGLPIGQRWVNGGEIYILIWANRLKSSWQERWSNWPDLSLIRTSW